MAITTNLTIVATDTANHLWNLTLPDYYWTTQYQEYLYAVQDATVWPSSDVALHYEEDYDSFEWCNRCGFSYMPDFTKCGC